MTQDEEWLSWRRGGLGGSDIPAVLGLSPYGTPFTVWCDKRGLLPHSEQTQRQRIGHLLEAAIGELFHEETGLYVAGEQTWCVHPEHDWARCTVDGFVIDHALDEQWPDDIEALGTLQIKTDGRFGWDDIPNNIRAQCVWEMGVTGLRHCWLAVLHAGFRFEVYEIDWDADTEADWVYMLDVAGMFWNDHILTGNPPLIDGSDATTAAIGVLYPDHQPGKTADLTPLADLLEQRDQLARAVSVTKKELDALSNQIRAALGDAEVGLVDGRPVVTYRTSQRDGYTVAATTTRTLRKASKTDIKEHTTP